MAVKKLNEEARLKEAFEKGAMNGSSEKEMNSFYLTSDRIAYQIGMEKKAEMKEDYLAENWPGILAEIQERTRNS